MNRHLFYAVCAAALFAALANFAMAQIPLIPTNVPGISVVPPPPAGFDPIAATPAEREQYAIPPAPDPIAAPDAYAEWQRAMSVPQDYETPVLETTDLYNQPNIPVGAPEPISDKSVTATSSNWSGTSVIDGDFTTLEAIEGEFCALRAAVCWHGEERARANPAQVRVSPRRNVPWAAGFEAHRPSVT